MRLTKDVFSAILYGGKLYSKPKKKEKIMNKKHFTLVEVLVVVGIIGILAGLVIPAVGLARQAGRRTECVSNQGQLMKLLTTTMQANDSYLVSGDNYNEGESNSAPAWTRYLYDKNKLQDLKGYRCPGLPTDAQSALGSSPTTAQLQAALGVVVSDNTTSGKKFKGFDFRGTKVLKDSSSNQIAPSQLVLGGCSAVVPASNSNDPITPQADLFGAGSFALVHGDEFNMFFLDGHVDTVTKEEATNRKYRPNTDGAKSQLIADGDIKEID